MIIRTSIGSLRDSLESPSIGLTDKGRVLGVTEKGGHHADFKLSGLEDLPGSTVRHPGNNILKVRTAENGVHLGREIGRFSWRDKRIKGIGVCILGVIVIRIEWVSADL